MLYPYTEGSHFDWDYYAHKHLPMVAQLLAPALKGWSAAKGVSGARPGSAPAFAAMGQMLFDSAEAFRAGFGPHAKAIGADLANYTTIVPSIQISEVLSPPLGGS